MNPVTRRGHGIHAYEWESVSIGEGKKWIENPHCEQCLVELGRDRLAGRADDDDRHAGGQPRPADGAEIPVDEGSARVDDIALLDEGSKASAAQPDGVDAQVNEDRGPARRRDNRRVRFELGDHSVNRGVNGHARDIIVRQERSTIPDDATGEDWIRYLGQGQDVRVERRANEKTHWLAFICSTRSSESGPMTT